MRIALIHATPLAMAPVTDAFGRLWPEAELMHLLDDRLSADRANGVPVDQTDQRIAELGAYARKAGAEGILYTCSAFGPAIEAVAKAMDCPVLKPNEAMFRAAIGYGQTLGLLASFEPSLQPMTAEFAEMSERTLKTACAPDAMAALNEGDGARHDNLLADAAAALAGCDAIMLAQFSTARAQHAVAAATGLPVLTSPESAVAALKEALT